MESKHVIEQGSVINMGRSLSDQICVVIKCTENNNLVLYNTQYDTWIIRSVEEVRNLLKTGKWFLRAPEQY